MTDLDTFAAAALTGLLAAPTDKDRSWEYWARLAYEAADAMLRERVRAAPAAPSSRSSETRASGVAHAQAWSCDLHRYVTAGEEQRMFGNKSHDAVRPTLTAEEREAIAWAAEMIPAMAHPSSASAHIHANTLRTLLERLK